MARGSWSLLHPELEYVLNFVSFSFSSSILLFGSQRLVLDFASDYSADRLGCQRWSSLRVGTDSINLVL